jgi:TetR/AcrR family transcriptional regulator, regulator of cefoperazone and chloramphenicol sensitivity
MSRAEMEEVSRLGARGRLLLAALRIFADKGYEGATTRDICELAGANISAIRYYFGDKAGLYRAAFTEPMGDFPCHANMDACREDRPLNEAMELFFRQFLEPLKRGEEMRLVMKLHFREMVEPTGVWEHEIEAEIKPTLEAMVTMLKRYFSLTRMDADVYRLAFAIIGMAVHFYVGQDVVAAVAPHLLHTPKAVDQLANRLAGYATAMIETEARRRAQDTQHV